jgi:hypothetical protein
MEHGGTRGDSRAQWQREVVADQDHYQGMLSALPGASVPVANPGRRVVAAFRLADSAGNCDERSGHDLHQALPVLETTLSGFFGSTGSGLKLLASLNHPHIAQILEAQQAGGVAAQDFRAVGLGHLE